MKSIKKYDGYKQQSSSTLNDKSSPTTFVLKLKMTGALSREKLKAVILTFPL